MAASHKLALGNQLHLTGSSKETLCCTVMEENTMHALVESIQLSTAMEDSPSTITRCRHRSINTEVTLVVCLVREYAPRLPPEGTAPIRRALAAPETRIFHSSLSLEGIPGPADILRIFSMESNALAMHHQHEILSFIRDKAAEATMNQNKEVTLLLRMNLLFSDSTIPGADEGSRRASSLAGRSRPPGAPDMSTEESNYESVQVRVGTDECPICHRQLLPMHDNIYSPCGHAYHSICIGAWMQDFDTCPMCEYRLRH